MRTPDGEESFNGSDATAFREGRTTPEMVADVHSLPGSALDDQLPDLSRDPLLTASLAA